MSSGGRAASSASSSRSERTPAPSRSSSSDLDPVLARWGSRGYRAVNLAAGLLGGRLYLGAYGFGLGATGLTFYDDEVAQFFEPDAAGKEAIFVTALGPAARRRPPRNLPVAPAALEPLRPGEA